MNRFRQPMYPGWPVRQIELSYLPARLGIDSWAPERDSVTRFFASGFFHQSVSPQPQSIPFGPVRIFSKIRALALLSTAATLAFWRTASVAAAAVAEPATAAAATDTASSANGCCSCQRLLLLILVTTASPTADAAPVEGCWEQVQSSCTGCCSWRRLLLLPMAASPVDGCCSC